MLRTRVCWLLLVSAAGCNWLAGIDKRETAAGDRGGEAGASVSGQGGHGVADAGDDSSLAGAGEAGSGTEGGAAGNGGKIGSGGTLSSGGTEVSGGGRAANGGATSAGGGAGQGGAASGGKGGATSGGKGGTGGTSMAGCSGDTDHLLKDDWYINTGPEGGSFTPTPIASGLTFKPGQCACIKGKWADYAQIYFETHNPFRFTTLRLTLRGQPNQAIPTIYVYAQNANDPENPFKYCLILNSDEQLAVLRGEPLKLPINRFYAAEICTPAAPRLPADSVIEKVATQFDTHEPHEPMLTDFDLCVLEITPE